MGQALDFLLGVAWERVDLPSAAGAPVVGVRVVSGTELTEFLILSREAGEDHAKRAAAVTHLVGCSVCDETGARLFARGEEMRAGDMRAEWFSALSDAALRVNRMTQASQEEVSGKSVAPCLSGSGSG